MKIQCNVCEAAEAKVLCCADEAALCLECDEKVHAANKLAGKHQRVSLSDSSNSNMPKCDICQEGVGYFFCLEDRALFCRKCDVAIHTVNSLVSAHRRFLLTGVQVGLECTEAGASSSSGKWQSDEKVSGIEESRSFSQNTNRMSMAGEYNKVLPMQTSEVGNFISPEFQLGGGSAPGSMPPWQMDDYYGSDEFTQNYGFMDQISSKADSGKLGDADCSSFLRMGEEELDGDECLGQVPDSSWMVPEMPSPPTASGLYWPKNFHNFSNANAFVPDICSSPMPNSACYRPSGTSSRRRQL